MKKFITVLSIFYFMNIVHPTNASKGIHREVINLEYISGQVRSCGSPRYPATIKAKRENSLNTTYKLS